MTAAQVTLGALLAAALGGTVWGYSRKYGARSGRQRFYRTIGMAALDLLALLAFLAVVVDFREGVTPRLGAARYVLILASCVLLVVLLVFVALLDALESYVIVRRERRTVVTQILQEEIDRAQARSTKKPRAPMISIGEDEDGASEEEETSATSGDRGGPRAA